MNEQAASGQHLPFNEGLPTKPDVDLLVKTWPDPKLGDRFPYEVIEEILGVEHTSTRFRTVCNNWRSRMLDEKGAVIECENGEAFYCATADQVSARTYNVLRGFGRKARRHRKKLAIVKTETTEQRAIAEHQARLMLAVEKDAKKHRMNLLPSTEVKSQPKIAPPKQRDGAG